jgi:hypothetical protein
MHVGDKMCTWNWWGNPEGRRSFERPRHRWENNIKLIFSWNMAPSKAGIFGMGEIYFVGHQMRRF